MQDIPMATATLNFDTEVIQRSQAVPVLVDFWAPWCGPCRTLTPALEQAVADREGDVELVKINVDEHPQLAARYKVRGIPAVKLFRKGRIVAEFTGARSRPSIDSFLDQHLGPTHLEQVIADLTDRGGYDDILASLRLGYYDQALAEALNRIRSTDDEDRRSRLKELMVAVFEELGPDHKLSQHYRRQLAATVY
jgi:putative thioredoxin